MAVKFTEKSHAVFSVLQNKYSLLCGEAEVLDC